MKFSTSYHCENCIVTQCKFWLFFCCSTLTCSVFQITAQRCVFVSLLSGRFTSMVVINPPEEKLVNCALWKLHSDTVQIFAIFFVAPHWHVPLNIWIWSHLFQHFFLFFFDANISMLDRKFPFTKISIVFFFYILIDKELLILNCFSTWVNNGSLSSGWNKTTIYRKF